MKVVSLSKGACTYTVICPVCGFPVSFTADPDDISIECLVCFRTMNLRLNSDGTAEYMPGGDIWRLSR